MVPVGLVLKMSIGGSDKFLRIKDKIFVSKKTKKVWGREKMFWWETDYGETLFLENRF